MSPGRVVLAMILDALSGRSPLFRMQEFYEDKDIDHDTPRNVWYYIVTTLLSILMITTAG